MPVPVIYPFGDKELAPNSDEAPQPIAKGIYLRVKMMRWLRGIADKTVMDLIAHPAERREYS